MLHFIKKHSFFFLFLLGLILRLSLLFLDFSWDVNNHISWAKDLWGRGYINFYELRSSEVFATPYPNYPPLSLFTFYIFYPIQAFIEKIIWSLNISIPLFPSKLVFFVESRAFLAGMLKLPAVFADLGVAWLCLLFVKKIFPKNLKVKYLIACLILFNPAFFYNSSYWGQIDVIPIFFVLIAIYLLLFTKKSLLSAMSFTFALLFKPTALVYLPIYLIFFIRRFSFRKSLVVLFLCLLLFWFSFIPFTKNPSNVFSPFIIYSEKILATQSLPFVTNGAFNFWVLITWFRGIKDTMPFLLGISYRLWGYVIVGVLTLWILLRFLLSSPRMRGSRFLDSHFRKNDIPQNFFNAAFLIAFTCFLFLTKMHERYSMLPLLFLLLLTVKNKTRIKWFILLSLLSFLNLYHSWPVPHIEFMVKILFYPPVAVFISSLNLMLFLYFLQQFILVFSNKNEKS